MDVTNEVHSNDVLRELNELRQRTELTDVVLEVEGRSFPCHRPVLASCSPYFRSMFTSGYAETKQKRIKIKDVSAKVMAMILDYAYTGRFQMKPDRVQAVMSAARLLQVDFVGRKAAEYMKDHLDVFNCADVLMYADMLGEFALVEASKRYMASRFNEVALQPSFLQLPLDNLQSLLDRDDLMSNSEDDVVQAALRWIDFKQEERLQHVPDLCKSLRQSLISPKLHVTIESKCLSTDSKLVYSDSTTQRLGQVRTELQIFLREGGHEDLQSSAPCYNPSTGSLHAIDMPRDLDRSSRSVTITPDDELYLAGNIVARRLERPWKTWRKHTKWKKFYQYNHLFNTWEPRCKMIRPRARCGLVYLKGYIYAIGGECKGDDKGTAERYDPSCDEWAPIAPIPHTMSSELCAVTLDDSIYVMSKDGCYSFSATENKWNKIADMLQPPVRPQAIPYRGCIYCIDCDKEGACRSVEMYNPTQGEWKKTGNHPFSFDRATLMKHEENMYLLTLTNDEDEWDVEDMDFSIYWYQPETNSWLDTRGNRRLYPPLATWLRSGTRTDCLTARMIPMCLGDPDAWGCI
ncbi:kelch repeat and BTB domain-containing protein 8-like [Branchiostoma lanceolatum]|uniref:kelch repeat and BTB domain-containing protein 8-like n=1 Tax=Branchiostoma lanceolatum TaxID=7740 RepID=UPI003452C58F